MRAVRGDAANNNGGGLFNEGSVVTLRDVTVTNNRAWVAGGIGNGFGGTMTLALATVSGNSSRAGGGGIYKDGTLTLIDSSAARERVDPVAASDAERPRPSERRATGAN
jgi:predicted outer membrane repeat protein